MFTKSAISTAILCIIMMMPCSLWGNSTRVKDVSAEVLYSNQQQNASTSAANPWNDKTGAPWWLTALLTALGSIIAAILGYYYAVRKSFFDKKQKAYGKIIGIVSKIAFNPGEGDEKEYSEAMSKLWLYAPKKTALAMDEALGLIHKETAADDKMKALQRAVVLMRNDLLPGYAFWRKRLKPAEVKHLYTIFRRSS